MTFHTQNFNTRLTDMGDASENKFLEVAESLGRRPVRFGFDRPPFSIVKIAKKLRYTPDFIDDKGLIECQGFGRDQMVKLKVEKINALAAWDAEHPVYLFLWDSHKKRYCISPFADVMKMIEGGAAELAYFHDPKAYFAIKAESFADWVKP